MGQSWCFLWNIRNSDWCPISFVTCSQWAWITAVENIIVAVLKQVATQTINTWDNLTFLLWAMTLVLQWVFNWPTSSGPCGASGATLEMPRSENSGVPTFTQTDKLHCSLAPILSIFILELYVMFHLEKQNFYCLKTYNEKDGTSLPHWTSLDLLLLSGSSSWKVLSASHGSFTDFTEKWTCPSLVLGVGKLKIKCTILVLLWALPAKVELESKTSLGPVILGSWTAGKDLWKREGRKPV